MTSPTREEVARKIDPDAWAWYDRETRPIPEEAKAANRLSSDHKYIDRFYLSLGRADAVLSLFPEGRGEKEQAGRDAAALLITEEIARHDEDLAGVIDSHALADKILAPLLATRQSLIDIADGERLRWVKAAAKHTREDGRRSDYEQADLERARTAERIVEKMRAFLSVPQGETREGDRVSRSQPCADASALARDAALAGEGE